MSQEQEKASLPGELKIPDEDPLIVTKKSSALSMLKEFKMKQYENDLEAGQAGETAIKNMQKEIKAMMAGDTKQEFDKQKFELILTQDMIKLREEAEKIQDKLQNQRGKGDGGFGGRNLMPRKVEALSDLKALNPTEWRNIPPPVQKQFIATKKVFERLIDHCNKLDPDTIATYHQCEKFREYLLLKDETIFYQLKDRINKCYQALERKMRIAKGETDARFERMAGQVLEETMINVDRDSKNLRLSLEKMIQDKVRSATAQLTRDYKLHYEKQFAEQTKVDGLIGPGKKCPSKTLTQWIRDFNKQTEDAHERFKEFMIENRQQIVEYKDRAGHNFDKIKKTRKTQKEFLAANELKSEALDANLEKLQKVIDDVKEKADQTAENLNNNDTLAYVKDFLERKFVKQVEYRFSRIEDTVYEGDEISSYHTDKTYVKHVSSKYSEDKSLELDDSFSANVSPDNTNNVSPPASPDLVDKQEEMDKIGSIPATPAQEESPMKSIKSFEFGRKESAEETPGRITEASGREVGVSQNGREVGVSQNRQRTNSRAGIESTDRAKSSKGGGGQGAVGIKVKKLEKQINELKETVDKFKPKVDHMLQQNKSYQANNDTIINKIRIQVSNLNRIREETEKGLAKSMQKTKKGREGLKNAMAYFSEDGEQILKSQRSPRFSRGNSVGTQEHVKRSTIQIDQNSINHLSIPSSPDKKYWPHGDSVRIKNLGNSNDDNSLVTSKKSSLKKEGKQKRVSQLGDLPLKIHNLKLQIDGEDIQNDYQQEKSPRSASSLSGNNVQLRPRENSFSQQEEIIMGRSANKILQEGGQDIGLQKRPTAQFGIKKNSGKNVLTMNKRISDPTTSEYLNDYDISPRADKQGMINSRVPSLAPKLSKLKKNDHAQEIIQAQNKKMKIISNSKQKAKYMGPDQVTVETAFSQPGQGLSMFDLNASEHQNILYAQVVNMNRSSSAAAGAQQVNLKAVNNLKNYQSTAEAQRLAMEAHLAKYDTGAVRLAKERDQKRRRANQVSTSYESGEFLIKNKGVPSRNYRAASTMQIMDDNTEINLTRAEVPSYQPSMMQDESTIYQRNQSRLSDGTRTPMNVRTIPNEREFTVLATEFERLQYFAQRKDMQKQSRILHKPSVTEVNQFKIKSRPQTQGRNRGGTVSQMGTRTDSILIEQPKRPNTRQTQHHATSVGTTTTYKTRK